MLRDYLAKRIATTLVIFFVILNFQFVLFWVVNPVKPVQWVIDINFTKELAEKLTKLYGLDQPLHVQYSRYILNMLTLNFGVSFKSQLPVVYHLADYLPSTLILVLTAVVIEIAMGISVGLYAAVKRASIIDVLLTGLGLLSYAVPSFVLLLISRYVLAEKLHWFPVIGNVIYPSPDPFQYFCQFMYHMALPLITLAGIGFGSWAFYTRNLSLDVLTQDYVMTARAKGMDDRKIIFSQVFPAILPPIVTVVLISLPATIFGSLVTEYIFTWKGIGWWYLNSIWSGDYPAVQALFFIYTVMLLLSNFVADILYGYLDPRIRVGTRR